MVSVKKLDVCIAIVGKSGMGALEYYPENIFLQKEEQMSLDEIAKECERIFETNNSESLDTIFQMGGSSGGARPKVYYDIDGEEWIVKFPSSYDSKDIGQQEYEYSLCAGRCGINMPETRLLNSSIGSGNGKTAGKGHKGQKARSGAPRPGFEGGQMPLYRRIPKRGFTNRNTLEIVGINVSALERFDNDAVVTVDELIATGIVKNPRDGVKILGNGELTKKLTVKANAF